MGECMINSGYSMIFCCNKFVWGCLGYKEIDSSMKLCSYWFLWIKYIYCIFFYFFLNSILFLVIVEIFWIYLLLFFLNGV